MILSELNQIRIHYYFYYSFILHFRKSNYLSINFEHLILITAKTKTNKVTLVDIFNFFSRNTVVVVNYYKYFIGSYMGQRSD
jgi:hypothetical protein